MFWIYCFRKLSLMNLGILAAAAAVEEICSQQAS